MPVSPNPQALWCSTPVQHWGATVVHTVHSAALATLLSFFRGMVFQIMKPAVAEAPAEGMAVETHDARHSARTGKRANAPRLKSGSRRLELC